MAKVIATIDWVEDIASVAKATPTTFIGMADQAVQCVAAVPHLVARIRKLEAEIEALKRLN